MFFRTLALASAAATGAAMLAATPAAAQSTVDEIVIYPYAGTDREPATLSRVVSFRDLDLRTQAGQDALKDRIQSTARDLCDELGAHGPTLAPGEGCVTQAVARAQPQMRMAIAQAFQPRYAYVPVAPTYVAPVGETGDASATAPDWQPAPVPQGASAANDVSTTASATYTVTTVTNGVVPDTPENRARFGGPRSEAGRNTTPAGN